MNKQTPTPHQLRKQSVHGLFMILIGFIALIMAFTSCSPKHGCYGTRGMSGYGWLKNIETGRVSILAPDGSIVCTYWEKSK
jgi:hypothetical protein